MKVCNGLYRQESQVVTAANEEREEVETDLGGGIDCSKVVRSGADSAHGTALGPEGERVGDLERGNLRQGLCEVGAGAIKGVVGQVRDCKRFNTPQRMASERAIATA